MGAADVVPGVSGGTMAFILGIYEELIYAIHAFNWKFVRRLLTFRFREAFEGFPWRFLLVLGLGIGTAVFTLARGLNWSLIHHPTHVWGFFFGLVLASVIAVRNRVSRWSVSAWITAAISTVILYIIVGLVPAETPDAAWFVFLSGAIAICAMILPGISGAFILVLLGKYRFALDAVVRGELLTLLVLMAGCIVGLISFVRLIRWFFRYHHDLTIAALTGLMLGSLRKVWPWKQTIASIPGSHGEIIPIQQINVLPSVFTWEVSLTLGVAIFGFGFVLILERLRTSRSGP